MLMLSGPVELLFLLFLIAVCTCSVVMFICVGCSLCTFMVIFLFVVLVLKGKELLSCCGGRLWASPCIVFQ